MIPLGPRVAPPIIARGRFAFWLGGTGAALPPAPVIPPKGEYWHRRYWPAKPKAAEAARPSRRR
jgi:hypothetical protein